MAKKELERRSFLFDIRAEELDSGYIITGRPIVYNSRTNIGGYFDEIIERGALDNADLTDVRFLVNHDLSKIPLARSRRNTPNSTMQLMVDADGLLIRVSLDVENNAEASSLYSAVKRGDITGMSFMFSVDDEEWSEMDTDHPTRHIRKIGTVVEVSAVTFPAYEATTIDARSQEALDNAKKALESAKEAMEIAKRSESNNKSSVETELELLRLKTRSILLSAKGGKNNET